MDVVVKGLIGLFLIIPTGIWLTRWGLNLADMKSGDANLTKVIVQWIAYLVVYVVVIWLIYQIYLSPYL